MNTVVWMSVELRVGIEESIPWNQPTTKIPLPQNRPFPLRIGRNWPAPLPLRQPAAPPPTASGEPTLRPCLPSPTGRPSPSSLHRRGYTSRGLPILPYLPSPTGHAVPSYLSPSTRRRTGSKSTTGRSSGARSSSTARRTSVAWLHLSFRWRAAQHTSPASLHGEPCGAPPIAPSTASPAPLLHRRAAWLLPCLPRRWYSPAASIPSCDFIHIQTMALIL